MQKSCVYQDRLGSVRPCSTCRHLEEEEKITLYEYGASAKHIFQAITQPFLDDVDAKGKLTWRVLSCISYFHHDNMPRLLLERCYQNFREVIPRNVKHQNKKDSGSLMSELENRALCSAGNESMNFHEVVLHAFRACQVREKRGFNSLDDALQVIAGLLTKDLRNEESANRMRMLVKHAQALLKHIQIDGLNVDNQLMKLVISHVYETAGAITSGGESSSRQLSDDYFENAIKYIWKDKRYPLTNAEEHFDNIDTIADCILDKCETPSQQLPLGVITKYEKIIFMPPSLTHLEFLEKRSNKKEEFNEAKAAILSKKDVQKGYDFLQKSGVILDESVFKNFFLVERLASILHSWSRVLIFKEEDSIVPEYSYMWFSVLSNKLAQKCREKFHISILAERLSIVTGKIPIILRLKSDFNLLNEIKEFCEKELNPSQDHQTIDFYEHGLLKEVPLGTHSKNRLHMLRHLVKIYTRLLKLQRSDELVEKGHLVCKELLELASDQVKKLSNAPSWIVRCAKFCAAADKFDEALNCMDVYFDWKM